MTYSEAVVLVAITLHEGFFNKVVASLFWITAMRMVYGNTFDIGRADVSKALSNRLSCDHA